MEIINTERIPLFVFTDPGNLEKDCLRQARNMSNLPVAYHHAALMPDAHVGYGMPIGGVLALDGAICPNAVGVDIGCGMAYVASDLPAVEVEKDYLQQFVNQVMRDIPTGFRIHDQPQPGTGFLKESLLPAPLGKEIDRAKRSLGTLGGGNHFIDLLEDDQGRVSLMVHTGSRHFGYAVANYFHRLAQKQCQERKIALPDQNLAYLDAGTEEASSYIEAMKLAMEFGKENRRRILEEAKRILAEIFGPVNFGQQLNAHHNYAVREVHFGKEVWVHRKGAIRAGKGETVIVPGSLGTASYIGIGLGNPASFFSCAHGAGRAMGRSEAKRKYSPQEILADIEKRGIILGKANKSNIAEESPWVYKDIERVIKDQEQLAKMEVKLMPLAVVIG
jgi:tRNA-splicing ligase RtcB (3'-phosphate/5'-hydroxy nucleic acid ligase)